MNAIIRTAEEGDWIELGPNAIQVRLHGPETGGAFSLCEYVMPAGGPQPPPHIHRRTDETFHVLEGRLTFEVNGETRHAGQGTTVQIPRDTLHTWGNDGDGTARVLLLFAPAGFERYFVEMGAFLATLPPGPPDPEVLRRKALELGERFDQVLPDT